MTQCEFINNTGNIGGAIRNINSYMFVTDSNFTNNKVTDSGGAITSDNSNITIYNSNFINNSAGNFGGALAIAEFDQSISTNTTNINNCNFTNNNATNGGAITSITNTTINNCNFKNNNATYGGAIFNLLNIAINNSNFLRNTLSAIYSVQEFEGQRFGNSTNLTVLNSNFVDNELAIYNSGNTTIQGTNIINNTKGIFINESSENSIINYNRIFNNTEYDLNNIGIVNADFNWWGSNNPNMTKIIGTIPNNHFIMNITNITSPNSTGKVTFTYIFKLNNSDSFNPNLLPYFKTDVYTNLTNGIINSFDARFNKTFDVTLNTSGNILYSFITDNEMETIEGTITIPPKPPTPEPNNNKTSNAVKSATMKKTGIPINMILIILLSVLGALIGKKRY